MGRNGEATFKTTGAKSKTNRDVKFASHKQTLQRTVRAKKINESHLFNVLRSVDDQKSRRSVQIDKEVGEVEKFLQKLTKDQGEIRRLKMIRRNTQSALSNSLPATSPYDKPFRKQSTNSDFRDGSNFDRVDFKMKMARKSKSPDTATELITSYYKFDVNGNRVNNVQMNSLSSPLAGFKESKVAWEYIPEDWSMSGLSLRDFGNFSAKSSKQSETSSARSRLSSSDVPPAGDGSDTCSSALDVPISAFEEAQRTRNHTPLPGNSDSIRNESGVVGMGGREEFKSPLKNQVISADFDTPEIESGRKSNLRRRDNSSGGLRREVTFNETPEVTHISSHVTRKTFPECNQPVNSVHSGDSGVPPNECEYSDCIYHNRTYLLSARDKECTAHDYYKTLSRVGEITGKMAKILGKESGTPPSEWKSARRSAVTASPTPSDIFRDIDSSVGNRAKPDYTDLDVMSSVRRPTKGSNREMMLRTKEVNLITTFALMRKRVADRVPQEFNRNYGTPTPNWKILNPLKLRHKIAHSSPLFVKWNM